MPMNVPQIRGSARVLLIALVMYLAGPAGAAVFVDLTLFNSRALLDSDATTPLEGQASFGDFVQLILTGPNGVIDTPDAFGNPGGDDTYLTPSNNPTYVGAGTTTTNTGELVQANMFFDDTYVGSNAYVRFWNDSTPDLATHYGNSDIFSLPAADFFGQAQLDFTPNPGSPRITDTPFDAQESQVIPEPDGLLLMGLLLAPFLRRLRQKRALT